MCIRDRKGTRRNRAPALPRKNGNSLRPGQRRLAVLPFPSGISTFSEQPSDRPRAGTPRPLAAFPCCCRAFRPAPGDGTSCRSPASPGPAASFRATAPLPRVREAPRGPSPHLLPRRLSLIHISPAAPQRGAGLPGCIRRRKVGMFPAGSEGGTSRPGEGLFQEEEGCCFQSRRPWGEGLSLIHIW